MVRNVLVGPVTCLRSENLCLMHRGSSLEAARRVGNRQWTQCAMVMRSDHVLELFISQSNHIW